MNQTSAGRRRSPVESLSRRRFLALGLAGGVGLLAATATPSLVAAQATPNVGSVQQLVIAQGGGALGNAYRKAYFEPFSQLTGVKIVEADSDSAKLKAMVESGNLEWDLAQLDAGDAASAGKQNLLEPLDYTVIPKDRLIADTAQEHYVIADVAGLTVAWNTSAVAGAGPTSWSDFFDVNAFPGRRGMLKTAGQTLEAALLGDGIDRASLYPLDVDRAFSVLDRIKSSAVWWESGAQSIQLLLDGETDLSMMWNGRIQQPKDDGKPVDFTFNQALLVADAWAIPRGAKQKDAAMQFIAFAMRAEQEAIFSQAIPYIGPNASSTDSLDAAVKAKLPPSPQAGTTVLQNFGYWADNGPALADRFNQWLLT
jgi:putative spermidine/putrescine transport system substrate-binding protein